MALTSAIQVTLYCCLFRTIEQHHTSNMETCMFFFGYLHWSLWQLQAFNWAEFFLSLSVKLQNGYRDKKMSPEPTSIKHWVVNGWNINFGRATPLMVPFLLFSDMLFVPLLQHMVTDSYPSLMLKLSRGHIHHAGQERLASCARRCARRMVSAAGHTGASLPFRPRW